MRIKSVQLNNFKVFAGQNFIELDGEKPITIIGGMNGRGKTTILEAILLALYGKRSFLFLESKLSYPMYLNNLINKADGTNITSIALNIEMPVDSEDSNLTVIRDWSESVNVPSVKTTVLNQGYVDTFLSDSWDSFIEDVLPSTIAPLFFFDGEKISGIANTNDDSYIGESIKALLGINVIDTTIEDLKNLLKKKRKPVTSNSIDHEIELYEDELRNIDLDIKQAMEQAGLLDAKRIVLSNKLNQYEEHFLAVGGEAALKLSEIRNRELQIRAEIEHSNASLVTACASDLPLVMVRSLLEQIHSAAKIESQNRDLQAAMQLLPNTLEKYCLQQDVSFDIKGFTKYLATGFTKEESVFQMSTDGMEQLGRLLKTDLNESLAKINQLLKKHHTLLAEQRNIQDRLSTKFDEDAATFAQQQMLDTAIELGTIHEQYRAVQQTIQDYHSKHQEISRKQARLLENALRGQKEIDDEERVVLYSNYSLEVFREYRRQLLANKTEQLAQVMCECFQKIIAKDNLIHKIRIDTDTLNFHYFDAESHEIQLIMLSAGERQLLIIAMLWAIGLCSGKKFPLVIDTPLARLDSAHRTLLVQNFLPHASEQIIILSTDEEIYGDTYQALKPIIGKEFVLQYDPVKKQTTVLSGYFGGKKP